MLQHSCFYQQFVHSYSSIDFSGPFGLVLFGIGTDTETSVGAGRSVGAAPCEYHPPTYRTLHGTSWGSARGLHEERVKDSAATWVGVTLLQHHCAFHRGSHHILSKENLTE